MAWGWFHKKLFKIRGPLTSFLSETITFCFEIIVKGSIYLRMAFAALPWSTFKIQGMALHGSSALLYLPILLPLKQTTGKTEVEQFSYDLEKWFRYSVRYLFHQPISEKIKTWTLRFPAKENPNMVKALFDWPIVLQYDVKAISRKFFGHEVCLPKRSLSQPKARCICIRFIHQSNRSISVRLLFLFCSRVFISRSYKNRSIL